MRCAFSFDYPFRLLVAHVLERVREQRCESSAPRTPRCAPSNFLTPFRFDFYTLFLDLGHPSLSLFFFLFVTRFLCSKPTDEDRRHRSPGGTRSPRCEIVFLPFSFVHVRNVDDPGLYVSSKSDPLSPQKTLMTHFNPPSMIQMPSSLSRGDSWPFHCSSPIPSLFQIAVLP